MSEHAPVFSDPVIGTPIQENAFPVNRQRRVSDRGTHMLETHQKRSEDTLDWSIDLLRWLEPDESVSSAQAMVSPADLVVQRVQFAPTGVVMWLTGGFDAVAHEVRCLVGTNQGRVKLFRFRMVTRGVPGTTPGPVRLSLYVSDAVLRDVSGNALSLSVTDAVLRALPATGPAVAFTPTSVIFTETPVGEASEMEITISNSGDQSLVISLISASGDFTVLGQV